MRSLMRQMPYLGPRKERPFRKAGLKEGPRRLRDAELERAFSTFSYLSADDRCRRFMAARAAVEAMGGSVDIVEEHRVGLRLKVRLELPTRDKTLDPELYALVAGMGFDLSLESRPVAGRPRDMERTYAVTERRCGEGLEYAHVRAEDLVRLDSLLSGKVRMPFMAKVVPLPVRAAEPQASREQSEDRLVAMRATR